MTTEQSFMGSCRGAGARSGSAIYRALAVHHVVGACFHTHLVRATPDPLGGPKTPVRLTRIAPPAIHRWTLYWSLPNDSCPSPILSKKMARGLPIASCCFRIALTFLSCLQSGGGSRMVRSGWAAASDCERWPKRSRRTALTPNHSRPG